MAKKYLSIEETANALGVEIDDVTRVREAGELRGFADRGTWKFRAEDVEEYQRSQQADSSDDNPLNDDLLPIPAGEFESEDVTSILDDDDDVDAEQPTLVQQSVDEPPLLDLTSDSDVRLAVDDALGVDEDETSPPPVSDTDSDVRLVADPAQDDAGESDIRILDGDSTSDVQLEAGLPAGAEPGSDSDVKLVQSEEEAAPADLAATSIEDPREIDGDLGMTEVAEDSGVFLEMSDESGISLEAVEGSGVSLEADEESSVSLEAADESGISLESVESGITLSDETIGGSGIALDMGDENVDETQLEVPVLADGSASTDFDMGDEEDSATDTSVLLFDDEDDADDYTDTVVKKSDDIDVFEEFAEGDEDELDVVDDDIFGDDDELGDFDDVLDVDDDDFADVDDEGYDEPIASPISVTVAVEHEWGLGAFLPLLATTGLMLFCGIVLFELVRSIWGQADPNFSSGLIESIGGLFGG